MAAYREAKVTDDSEIENSKPGNERIDLGKDSGISAKKELGSLNGSHCNTSEDSLRRFFDGIESIKSKTQHLKLNMKDSIEQAIEQNEKYVNWKKGGGKLNSLYITDDKNLRYTLSAFDLIFTKPIATGTKLKVWQCNKKDKPDFQVFKCEIGKKLTEGMVQDLTADESIGINYWFIPFTNLCQVVIRYNTPQNVRRDVKQCLDSTYLELMNEETGTLALFKAFGKAIGGKVSDKISYTREVIRRKNSSVPVSKQFSAGALLLLIIITGFSFLLNPYQKKSDTSKRVALFIGAESYLETSPGQSFSKSDDVTDQKREETASAESKGKGKNENGKNNKKSAIISPEVSNESPDKLVEPSEPQREAFAGTVKECSEPLETEITRSVKNPSETLMSEEENKPVNTFDVFIHQKTSCGEGSLLDHTIGVNSGRGENYQTEMNSETIQEPKDEIFSSANK